MKVFLDTDMCIQTLKKHCKNIESERTLEGSCTDRAGGQRDGKASSAQHASSMRTGCLCSKGLTRSAQGPRLLSSKDQISPTHHTPITAGHSPNPASACRLLPIFSVSC